LGSREHVTVLKADGAASQPIVEQIARGVLAGKQVAASDARYLLAELLYVKLDKPKPALRLIKELQRKVKEKEGSYHYSAAMNDLSLEIQDYLAAERGSEQE